MAGSADIGKLPVKKRAEYVHHALHGKTYEVKDVFKYILAGAVVGREIEHVTVGAKAVLDKLGVKAKHGKFKNAHYPGLVVEHVVPTEFLYKWITARKDELSVKDIEQVLLNCPVCLVTKDDDALLREAKLQKTMPKADFDCLEGDCFSRYRAAGLKRLF